MVSFYSTQSTRMFWFHITLSQIRLFFRLTVIFLLQLWKSSFCDLLVSIVDASLQQLCFVFLHKALSLLAAFRISLLSLVFCSLLWCIWCVFPYRDECWKLLSSRFWSSGLALILESSNFKIVQLQILSFMLSVELYIYVCVCVCTYTHIYIFHNFHLLIFSFLWM